MTKRKGPEGNLERRKQDRLHKLGTNTPRCAVCGNSDWRCIEEHHPATRKSDKRVVLLCANHHRLVTYGQKDHPLENHGCDVFLVSVGNCLLGLADMFVIIVEILCEFGKALIERANATALKSEGRT